jgi:CspA family cold shock protein
MPTGTVKWINDAKGYGFIAPDDGGEDLFGHLSEVRVEGFESLTENQKVNFDVKEGRMRRARAVENSLDKRLRMRQAKPAAGRRDQPDEGGDGSRCFATFQGNSSSMRLAW